MIHCQNVGSGCVEENNMLRFSFLIATLAGLSTLASAQEAPQIYMGRVVAKTMHFTGAGWLIRHKRDREESATQMREALELKPGMVVCDMGSGNGYHSLPMAKAVAPERARRR